MSAIRFGGLSSGLDTENIIKQLMSVERTKVDKIFQQQQLSVYKKEQYQEVNKKLADFVLESKAELGLTGTTSTGTFVNQSTSSMTWIKSATTTNESAASVEASADAAQGTYQVKVNNLASNWSSASGEKLGSTDDRTSMASQFGLTDTDIINFTITSKSGESLEINTLAKDSSLSEIAKDINAADLGVTAVYDANTDRFFLQTNDTGTEHGITIQDNSIFDAAGPDSFLSGANSVLKLQHQDRATGNYVALTNGTEYTGVNASIDFGAATNIEFASNDFTVNNIRFSLKETTATAFQVSVNSDVEGAYDKISEFVNKYNSLLDELGGVVSQKRDREYVPLTDEQKESMSDREIELWEKRTKSGLLANDSLIGRITSSARSGFYQEVEGVSGSFNHLTNIGISTEGYSSGSAGGRLQIDETKLKTALQQDIDGVMELLFKEPSSELRGSESNLDAGQLAQKRSESGLFNRLFDNMAVGMKSIIAQAGPGDDATTFRRVQPSMLLDFVTRQSSISVLDRGVIDYDKRINNMERILSNREEAYWRKYTAMEKALSQMDSQIGWINQQMGQNA